MVCHQIQFHAATTSLSTTRSNDKDACIASQGRIGGRHGGPPPLPPRMPNRPFIQMTSRIRYSCASAILRGKIIVNTLLPSTRACANGLSNTVRLSVRLSVSPVKTFVISTLTGLNSCYTRRWHGNLKKIMYAYLKEAKPVPPLLFYLTLALSNHLEYGGDRVYTDSKHVFASTSLLVLRLREAGRGAGNEATHPLNLTAGNEATIWQVSEIWRVISVKKKRTLLRELDEVGHLLYKADQLLCEVGQQSGCGSPPSHTLRRERVWSRCNHWVVVTRNLMWPIRSAHFVHRLRCHGVQLRHNVFSGYQHLITRDNWGEPERAPH